MALWVESEAVELRPSATEDDLQIVIRAVYRQVLGNAHVMESQRLATAESMLRNGDLSVRDFVRAVAQSDLYKALFFENSSPYRFVELNCKHLLGRAPQDQAEISAHVQIYNSDGYDAEINSYVSSEEYSANFGDNVVPYARSNRTQVGIKNVGFNRLFALVRGFASNDTGGTAKLTDDIASNRPTKIVRPSSGSGAYSNTGKRFKIRVTKTNFGPRTARSASTILVGYDQLSKNIQSIHRSGGKILSITEVA